MYHYLSIAARYCENEADLPFICEDVEIAHQLGFESFEHAIHLGHRAGIDVDAQVRAMVAVIDRHPVTQEDQLEGFIEQLEEASKMTLSERVKTEIRGLFSPDTPGLDRGALLDLIGFMALDSARPDGFSLSGEVVRQMKETVDQDSLRNASVPTLFARFLGIRTHTPDFPSPAIKTVPPQDPHPYLATFEKDSRELRHAQYLVRIKSQS